MIACVVAGVCAAASAQNVGPMPRDAHLGSSAATSPTANVPVTSDPERQPLGAPKSTLWSNQPSPGQAVAQNPTSLAGMVRTVLSLAGVVAIIVGLAYGFRRMSRGSDALMNQLGAGGRAPSGVLSILGRYPVARGTTLVLLKADRRVLLLCQTAGKGISSGCTMQTLTEFADPEDVASILLKTRDEEEASLAHRFEAILSREDNAASRAMAASAASSPRASVATPAQSRAVRAAAKQPEVVLRPTKMPSDPRAQIGRPPERAATHLEIEARATSKAPASGSLLRGVVA